MKTSILLTLFAMTASGAAWAAEADQPPVTDAATAALAQSWALRLDDQPATTTAEPQPVSGSVDAFSARGPKRMVYPGSVEAR